MRLLAEVVEHVKPLVESVDGGGKSYVIEGVFLQAEVKNRNGRLYPMEVLSREVARYNEEFVLQNRALGELGHPDSPSINLDRVSHMITSLESNGTDFIGRAKIMDTPFGKIVKSFIDEGVKFGVSSRGVGTIESSVRGDVVADDFFLATAADIVADPSAPDAFVRGLRESKEWVWNAGVLAQSQVEALDTMIKTETVKTPAQVKKLQIKVFERFMRELGKSMIIREAKSRAPALVISDKNYKELYGFFRDWLDSLLDNDRGTRKESSGAKLLKQYPARPTGDIRAAVRDLYNAVTDIVSSGLAGTEREFDRQFGALSKKMGYDIDDLIDAIVYK
tara:strand:+ start:13386 stop:14390 length:1005 start_codon:yes stop_codon:yes gene_type:complete